MKNCLTIAGSDCSGGAGIQADIKTFSALGCFGMSVITSVVAENTQRVISIQNIAPQIIGEQIDAVFEDIEVDAVKIGMLSDCEIMLIVAKKLKEYHPAMVVVDPVMIAKGGNALMQPEALEVLKNEIIPLSFLLTPNIPEAETITGRSIHNENDMKAAAKQIAELGAENVLIKGGHLSGNAVDILYTQKQYFSFRNERIDTKNTHGTGCTLSSAIAAFLAKAQPEPSLPSAVEKAKIYVTEAIRYSLAIGKGHGPTNHFYQFYKE